MDFSVSAQYFSVIDKILQYRYRNFYFFAHIVDVGVCLKEFNLVSPCAFVSLSMFFAASIDFTFMSISFDVSLSWFANSLLSVLIEFFRFSYAFSYCSIQSVVLSKYFFDLIVVVSLVNSC